MMICKKPIILICAAMLGAIIGCDRQQAPPQVTEVIREIQQPITYPMTPNQISSCCVHAGPIIRELYTNLKSVRVHTPFRQPVILDPRANPYKATHLLFAPVTLTGNADHETTYAYAIWCLDGNPVHVENCYIGTVDVYGG